jgi:hypothetical protein
MRPNGSDRIQDLMALQVFTQVREEKFPGHATFRRPMPIKRDPVT